MDAITDPFNEITEKMGKSTSSERAIRARIIRLQDEIYETYPQLTVAQHNLGIMRSKGETGSKIPGKPPLEPRQWSNQKYLSRLEKYKEELDLNNPETWGTDEDNFQYERKW